MKNKHNLWRAMICSLVIGGCSIGVEGLRFCQPLMAEVHEPTFNLSTTILDGDIYIKIEPYDPEDVTVKVNGSDSNVRRFNRDDNYYYRVPQSGEYRIEVTNSIGQTLLRFIEVGLDENPPTIELSRVYMNDNWYIHIQASDDYGLKSIYIEDESLAFDEDGDAGNYKVTESKTYVITAEDQMGNKTQKEIYIDVDQKQDVPEVRLSKEYKEGSWYLVIEAEDYYGIDEVKVNGEKITFDSNKDKRYYKTTKTDSYLVEVTDVDGNKVEEYLYIDVKAKVSIPPKVILKQLNQIDGTYVLIEIEDNGEIVFVQVEDQEVLYDKNTQSAKYRVSQTGTYHVIVKDHEGNEVKDSIHIDKLADIKEKRHTIIFTAGSKEWKKDGVSQNLLDVEPEVINDRLYLPIRYVAQALGIQQENILWNAEERALTVNGMRVEMDTPVVMVGERIMIPLSAISKVFERKQAQLVWDNQSKQVQINYTE